MLHIARLHRCFTAKARQSEHPKSVVTCSSACLGVFTPRVPLGLTVQSGCRLTAATPWVFSWVLSFPSGLGLAAHTGGLLSLVAVASVFAGMPGSVLGTFPSLGIMSPPLQSISSSQLILRKECSRRTPHFVHQADLRGSENWARDFASSFD